MKMTKALLMDEAGCQQLRFVRILSFTIALAGIFFNSLHCGNAAFFGQMQESPAAAQDDGQIGLNGSAEDDYVQDPPDAFGDSDVATGAQRMFNQMEDNGSLNEDLLDTLQIPTAEIFSLSNYQEYVNRLNEMGVLQEHTERSDILNLDDDLSDYNASLFFIHGSDSQVHDTESPMNLNAFRAVGNWGLISSAFHPNNAHIVHQMDDIIKTLRGIKNVVGRDYEFLVFSGDFPDTSQYNEVRWGMSVMNGGLVHADSGADDDPEPGFTGSGYPNDPFDPFNAHGTHIPWYLSIGNHDGLYLGNFPITDAVSVFGIELYEGTRATYDRIATGDKAYLGFSPNLADVIMNLGNTAQTIVPDEDRYLLDEYDIRAELFETSGQPVGHGMNAGSGDLYYAFDSDNGRYRVVNLATIASIFAGGYVSEEQFDWLENELSVAWAQRKLVIVNSHHAPSSISETPIISSIPFLDTFIDDGVKGQDIIDLFHTYPNVIAHLVAHSHSLKIKPRLAPNNSSSPEYSYWEINSGSWVTWPQQARIIEVLTDYPNRNGKIICTMINHEGDADRIGNQGRYLSYLEIKEGLLEPGGDYINPDYLFESSLEDKEGTELDQNVVLNFKMPFNFTGHVGWQNLEQKEPVGTHYPRVIPSLNYTPSE